MQTDIEDRLRDTGAKFIEAHDEATAVIRKAAAIGMVPEAISQASGLSEETVRAFLR
jgi:hypothetical protein